MSFKHSDEPLNQLAYEFLLRAAELVSATEAAAFAVEGAREDEGSRGGDLRLLSHVRSGGDVTPEVRDAAVRALDGFGREADLLRAAARFTIERRA